MKIRKLVTGLLFLTLSTVLKAQLSGIKTVPGTYTSVAAAIADLNLQGVNGALTINIAAGYTETAPVGGYSLTASGTSLNTITIQKSGVGANPILTAYAGGTGTPGTAFQDGVFRLIGSDYVTIDGININDPNAANPATMEFGYGFYKASNANGCQYNTIKNCVVTLNRENFATGTAPMVDGSVGILMLNSTSAAATTVLTATTSAGSNSYNKFYTNTIQNCNIGIALIGFAATAPFTAADFGNDVGGISSATGNTIINYGGGALATNPSAGVRTLAQYDFNVSNNVINNNNGSGLNHLSTLRGIYLNTALGASSIINSNTLTIKAGGTTSQVSVIENLAGSTGTLNTVSIQNNLITNCTYTSATSSIWYSIFNNGVSAANVFIDNNNIFNNSTNSSSTYYNIYQSGAATNSISVNSNTVNAISFTSPTVAVSGTFYGVANTTAGTTASMFFGNNTIKNILHTGSLPATGTMYFHYAYGAPTTAFIQNNKIDNLSLFSTGSWYLFYTYNGATNLTISDNGIVGSLNRTAVGGSGTIYGIYNTYGVTTVGSTAAVYNNNISNINNFACSGTIYGMYFGSCESQNVYNNTFSNINAPAGTGSLFAMYPYYYGTTVNYYNNTISNLTYGTGTLRGVYYYGYSQKNFSFYNNTISNLTSDGTTINGIYAYYTGGATAIPGQSYKFYKNKITNIASTHTLATNVSGFETYQYYGGPLSIYNNMIANITATNSASGDGIAGIKLAPYSANAIADVAYNTIYLSGTSTNTVLGFGSSVINTNLTGKLILRNNILVNNSVPTGSGIVTAIRASGTLTNTAQYDAASTNNLLYAGNPTTNTPIYYDGTSQVTLANYQALVGPARDISSVTENPTFASLVSTSPNFLHFNAGTTSLAESGGSNIAGITDDIDGQIRQGNAGYTGSVTATAPDIGADEFNGVTTSFVLNGIAITPTGNNCTAVSRVVTSTVTAGFFPITAATLNYAFNGVAQPTIAMVMASGSATAISTWSATIPAGVPATANVTWYVIATDGFSFKNANGVSYKDAPLTGVAMAASSLLNPICGAGSTTLIPQPYSTFPANYVTPSVTYPTSDEDLGNVTFGAINNTSLYNSLSGASLGTAAGTAGSYSDFTAYGPFNFVGGLTYPLSLSSLQNTYPYGNAFGVYIDYNRNGVFTDAGEKVYASTVTVSGAHTENAIVTIPTTAYSGLTRMRVIVNEGLVTSPTQVVYYGEFEDYLLNLFTPNQGGGAVTTFTSYAWVNGATTVGTSTTTGESVQSPSVNTTYSVTGTDINGCSVTSTPITITVTPTPATPIASNSSQCGYGVSTASVSGATNYKWYATPTSTTVLQTGTATTFTAPISASTTWYVESFTGACLSATRSAVTTTVNIPDAVSASSSKNLLCVGGSNSITLTATQTGTTNTYVYNWNSTPLAGSGLTGATPGRTITTTPTLPGVYTYSVLATDPVAQCATIATVTVALNTLPPIIAKATPSVICSGDNVFLKANGYVQGPQVSPVYLTFPTVSIPLNDEDFGNVTIMQGATTILDNTTANGSLVGTIGTAAAATSTAGAYSDFTSYGPYDLVPGGVYSFSLSSNTSASSYYNSVACYIDLNRNGVFTDAGELVYTSPATISGPHTESTTFTIPTSASSGLTRMRVMAYEGLLNSPTQTMTWGEYEEYTMNIQKDNTSAQTWTWTPGSIPTSTANVTPVNTASLAANSIYTISTTDIGTTCSNSSTVVVSVNPLPNAPVATNSVQCGYAIPTANVSGGTLYNWYATPTSTAVLQSSATPNFTNVISTTTTWYVNNQVGACKSATRTAVTQTVTTPDLVTATSTKSFMCVGSSNTFTLNAVNTGTTNTYSYTWVATPSAGSGMPTSVTGASAVVTPTALGTYSYKVFANDGSCNTISTVTVALNSLPPIVASATPTMICSGANVYLNASAIAATAATGTVGTGALTTTGEPNPYYTTYWGNKNQYLITAADLIASGYTTGNITSLGLYLISSTTTLPLTNFNISIGTTALTAMPATWQTGLTSVYSNPSYTLTPGTVNTHTFSTPFYWDGVSNLLIETCFNNAAWNGSQSIYYTTTSYVSGLYSYADAATVCSAPTTAYTSSNRPNFILGGQIGTNVSASHTFTWNPGSIPTRTANVTPVNSTTLATTNVYTVTAYNPSTTCVNTGTVGVLVNAIPVNPVATNSIQCGYGISTASVSGSTSYNWYATSVATTPIQVGASSTFTSPINSTTTWYAESFNGFCKSVGKTAVTQTVTVPDPILGVAVTNSICPNSPATFVASNTGTLNTYTYSWLGSTGASGITTPIFGTTVIATPTLSGTYTYTLLGIDGVCTAISTASLVVKPTIGTPILTSNPNPFCIGSTVTLTATYGNTVLPTYATPAAVTSPLLNNDIGNVTFGTLNNTSTFNSLVGTIGTAAGTAGGYANYLSFGSNKYIKNSTYTLSLSSLQGAASYVNGFGVFIDYNGNGAFTDAGEQVYVSPPTSTLTGAHTETTTVTIPATSNIGPLGMRVISTLGSPTGVGAITANMAIVQGEIEHYSVNIIPVSSYTWTQGATTIGSTNPIATTPTATTVYNLVSYDTQNGCAISSASVAATLAPSPTVTVNSGGVCSGYTFTMVPSGANTYTFASATGTVSSVITATALGSYSVTGTSVDGCISANTAISTVSVNPSPVITVNSGGICLGNTYTINPTSGTGLLAVVSTYTYSSGSDVVSPTSATNYTVTGTNTLGCVGSAVSTVTIIPAPVISVSGGTVCSGSVFNIVPSGALNYTLVSTGTPFTTNVAVTPTTTTSYIITGANAAGCTNNVVSTVTVAALPVVTASTASATICSGEVVNLSSTTSASGVTWNTGATTSVIAVTPTVTTTYTVNSTGNNGCVGSAAVTVNVNACVGINELSLNSLSIYPNPTTGIANITLSPAFVKNSSIEVYDALGKLVMVQALGNESNTINISNLDNGVYMFKVLNSSSTVKIGKLVKQ